MILITNPSFEHWEIRNLNLFSISIFDIRILTPMTRSVFADCHQLANGQYPPYSLAEVTAWAKISAMSYTFTFSSISKVFSPSSNMVVQKGQLTPIISGSSCSA